MALFSYQALDGSNQVREGVIEETDKGAVAGRLMRQGLRPLKIDTFREPKARGLGLPRLRPERLDKTDIEFFTKQVSLLLNAGLSLDAALRIIKQHSGKQVFKDFAGGLEKRLKEGKSFSEALADYPKLFSSMYVNIVRAGEEGGILPQMLLKISEYQATFQELKQFIISAAIYPALLLVAGGAAVIILVTGILPRFQVLFEGSGKMLPAHVEALMAVSGWLSNHLLLAFLGLAAVPAALILHARTPDGKVFYDRLVIRLPLLAEVVRELETTRIFHTLEVLVNNGVHLAVALKISAGVAGNLEFKRLLNRATEALKEGQQVGQKLKAEHLLPDLAADLLSVGEESGRVGHVCAQIAAHYERELKIRIKRVIALIEPALILLIALVVGVIVISMLSVILSINEIAV
ncbi:MAG: type II secretion system F family protein [Thermodesulfobacteriota bacterium]